MTPAEKDEIVRAYKHVEALLKKHLPVKREGSIHWHVHLTLTQSRFSFEASWDEPEDKHLEEKPS